MSIARVLALGAIVAGFGFSSLALAQTCASPAIWAMDATGSPALAGTTCGHETGIVGTCQTFTAPGAAYVVRINVIAPATFTDIAFTGGPGYTLAAYLVPEASGCNANAACTTTGDGTTHMLHVDIPPGAYYLIITGADFDAPGSCGTFTAASNGFLPVTLQSFNID
ncbi:hypothetical protein EV148_102276 [Dokdonella fugitiva]|jgi:hypothetical protein|uniref:Pre-peptidase n=2 Tax=Dokdonella fugitiva TaxID=328517 RepID=A0A4R2ICQ3_9GAMM|nr:hypothetical protein EV148_102276 [Dokdonella fugitiva]